MKYPLRLLALILSLAAPLRAQVVLHPHLLHQDIAPLLSKGGIPHSCEQAYEWCEKDATGMLVCPTLNKLLKEVEALNDQIAGADVPAPDPKAYQDRSPEAKEIVKACDQLRNLMTGDEATKYNGKFNSDLFAEGVRRDEIHLAVNKAHDAALDSCPKVHGGEGDYADPACQKAKNREVLVGHINAANESLANMQKIYGEYLPKLHAQFAAMDAIIAATNYGNKAKTQIYLDQITAAQATEISTVQGLISRYIDMTSEAAMYVQSLKDWERDNP